jgi:hypothetical protein
MGHDSSKKDALRERPQIQACWKSPALPNLSEQVSAGVAGETERNRQMIGFFVISFILLALLLVPMIGGIIQGVRINRIIKDKSDRIKAR